MPDYSKGKIYRIIGSGMTYIGSTCCPLRQRLAQHTYDLKRFQNGNKKKFTTSFNIIEKGEFEIFLIEDYPCDRREQLLMRERYYIDTMDCINKLKPIRTVEEKKEYDAKYKEDHKVELRLYRKELNFIRKDEISEYNKNYRENNYDKLQQNRKKKYSENLEKFKEYREEHKDYHKEYKKQYNIDNKNILKEKNQIYYQNNREERRRKGKEYYDKNKDKLYKNKRIKKLFRDELQFYNI